MKRPAVASVLLLVVITVLLMVANYYIESLSIQKQQLQFMKDSLIKDVEEFNSLQ